VEDYGSIAVTSKSSPNLYDDNHKKVRDYHDRSNTFMYQRQTSVIRQHLLVVRTKVLKYLNTKH
jgi:hypothetical protein